MLSPLHYNLCYMHHTRHKGHPTCATRTIFNAKFSQSVLHAPHSMQRPSNLCYTHHQSFSNLYYTHHIQCKVFPTCATRTTFNVKSSSQPVLHHTAFSAKTIQPVLHAPYSMQSPPNLCYTHHLQCKVLLPTCATHTTFNAKFSQPVLHTPPSMQSSPPNLCYTHHIQCKVFPTCATHTTFSAKSVQTK